MENRNKELLKNTIILSIGQIVPKLLAFILLPLLTTFLTEKDYGLYELTLSVASFCIPMLSLQIQQGVFRYLIEGKTNQKFIIAGSFYFIVCIFILSLLPIVIFWKYYTSDILISILFFIAYFSEEILTWEGQTIRGLGDNLSYSLAYVIYSMIFVTMLIIFLNINKTLNIYFVSISMIIAYIISSCFLMFKGKLYNYIKICNVNKKIIKMLLQYSSPMVISSIALWIVNLSDRFFVSGYLGLEVTAVYAVANKIPNLFNSFYGIFNLAWTENTSKLTQNEKNGTYYTDFFKSFYNIMVGMMLMLICVSPVVFKVLINEKYINAYGLMSWLFIGVFFNSIVSFLGSIYVGEKRTKDVGVSSAVGAIINILINLFFMKEFGIIVAALSTIISYAVICIYRAIDIRRYVKIEYNIGQIILGIVVILFIALINMKYSLIVWIISIVVMIAYNYIFNFFMIISILKKIKNKISSKNSSNC